ncbi:MAG: RluA family pseudouridine synthase [Thermoanaerobaculaceae bacterium]
MDRELKVECIVPPEQAGLRLDRFLANMGHGWSRSQVARWAQEGFVLRNGKPCKPAHLLKAGDVITVTPPPVQPTTVVAQELPLHVLYEDDHLLVINKPPGMVVHPAAGNPDGTLVNAILAYCQKLSGIGGVERPGIVHRLDKDTSGVMLVAKTDQAHRLLELAFRWRTTDKRYLALVYGEPKAQEGVIDAPVGRHPVERKRMAVVQNGRPARTLWWVEERFSGVTLLQCRPITGRTHQIRVHLASVGHAIVGDPLYAGRQWRQVSDVRLQEACRAFPRQALHAWRITFRHPEKGETVSFEAPPSPDFAQLLAVARAAT